MGCRCQTTGQAAPVDTTPPRALPLQAERGLPGKRAAGRAEETLLILNGYTVTVLLYFDGYISTKLMIGAGSNIALLLIY